MEEKEVRCQYCQGGISFNSEKYVLLGTYDGKRPIDESYFHFQCYVDFYNKQVKAKATNMIKGLKDKAMNSLKSAKQLLGNFGGLDSIPQMFDELSRNINPKPELEIEKNGKEKRRNF